MGIMRGYAILFFLMLERLLDDIESLAVIVLNIVPVDMPLPPSASAPGH